MLCERCKKNEASVFYRESVNGKQKSLSLCSECADKARKSGELDDEFMNGGFMETGFFEDPFFGTDKLFGSLFGTHALPGKTSEKVKKCSLCGSTFNDLVNAGKAGCPECYKTFAEELNPTISRIHGTTSHVGGAPSTFKKSREQKEKIKSLEAELKAAVKDENYERAAEIRDELRELRGEKEGENK